MYECQVHPISDFPFSHTMFSLLFPSKIYEQREENPRLNPTSSRYLICNVREYVVFFMLPPSIDNGFNLLFECTWDSP